MIKNIYKSYITTFIGVLFLIGGVAYPFYQENAIKEIMGMFILTGVVLLFTTDDKIKSWLNKGVEKITK